MRTSAGIYFFVWLFAQFSKSASRVMVSCCWLCSRHMTNFHLPLPEMHKEQIELISLTQIDGGHVLQRLVFNSADLWPLKKNADIIKGWIRLTRLRAPLRIRR